MSAWTCHQSEGKVAQKIVPPRLRTPCWKGPGADFEEKREPASDINTCAVDSLKVLDPERPIREADIAQSPCWRARTMTKSRSRYRARPVPHPHSTWGAVDVVGKPRRRAPSLSQGGTDRFGAISS